MESAVRTGRGAIAADLLLVGVLGGWLLWALIAAGRGDQGMLESPRYVVFPLLLGVGIVGGRCWARLAGAFLIPFFPIALALTALVVPVYANAQAAVGVQLVAVVGLMLSAAPRELSGARPGAGPVVLAVTAAVLGVLLAARAQAASVLVVLVVALVARALVRDVATSRRAIVGVGLTGVGSAALTVFVLGSVPAWPERLRQGESLSEARHELWRDALALWREHPLVGGGPGSFLEYSETARSEPHLYAAHSSVLQVAAELGTVGVLLFLAILVCGALVATRGDRARGLIGVTAWCALAVHSMIDHLYEFPIVLLLAGLVIGRAGSRIRARESTPPRDNAPRRDSV